MLMIAFGLINENTLFAAETETKKVEKPYVHHRAITYLKRGERELKAEVFVPKREGKFPAVLVVHGGAWTIGSRYQLIGVARKLSEAGFTSVAIDYRLAPKSKFPAQIHDCKSAVCWMRKNAKKYQIDTEHIGGYGYSAGGHLVTLLGVTQKRDGLEGPGLKKEGPSTQLQAVVAGGAPCDFQFIPQNSKALAYWLGGTRKEQPELYKKASPLIYADKNDPPILFIHGEKDRIVQREFMTNPMLSKLKKLKVDATMHVVINAGHARTMYNEAALNKSIAFLKEKLFTK